MRWLLHWFIVVPLKLIAGAAIKMFVMCFVFFTVTVLFLRWLGYQVPGMADLESYLEHIGELASILS